MGWVYNTMNIEKVERESVGLTPADSWCAVYCLDSGLGCRGRYAESN